MIIGDKFIFLHIPKAAGSSFCRMMRERHGLTESFDPHSTARDIPQELRETHFIFGFLRDPVKAEASNYFYHTSSWQHNFDTDMGFERWCEWKFGGKDQDWASPWIKRPDLRQYGHDFNARSSAGFFCDEDGKCIADHIFRFEDMKESTDALSDALGIDCDLSDYHVLATKSNQAPRPVITPRSEELIYKAKAIDFALHRGEGDISTNYSCPTVPNYAYTRL